MKIILHYFANHKIFTAFLGIALILAIVFTQFIAIHIGNIPSIALDRWQMERVNRIDVETIYGTTIIKDRQLIADFVAATMVARDWAQCSAGFSSGTVSFRLYRNSNFVRDMEFEFKHYQIRVYFPSQSHFFFFGQAASVGNSLQEFGGVVILPRELKGRIHQYLQSDGNRLFYTDPWWLLDPIAYRPNSAIIYVGIAIIIGILWIVTKPNFRKE